MTKHCGFVSINSVCLHQQNTVRHDNFWQPALGWISLLIFSLLPCRKRPDHKDSRISVKTQAALSHKDQTPPEALKTFLFAKDESEKSVHH